MLFSRAHEGVFRVERSQSGLGFKLSMGSMQVIGVCGVAYIIPLPLFPWSIYLHCGPYPRVGEDEKGHVDQLLGCLILE